MRLDIRRTAILCGVMIMAALPGRFVAGQQTSATIQGRVTTEEGRAVSGVNVAVSGTGLEATTGGDGGFTLQPVPSGRRLLVVSGLGYRQLEREVTVDGSSPLSLTLVLLPQPVQLGEITVTGSRSPTPLSDLTTSVSSLQQDEVRDQLLVITNIAQTLDARVPGFNAQRDDRNRTAPYIRGRAVQLMINGIPTNDNLRESNTRGLASISPFAVNEVEVVRGGTALFGAGSPGGIINVITRRASSRDMELEALIQAGMNDPRDGDTREFNTYVAAGQALGSWDYRAGFAYQDFGTRRNAEGGLVPGQKDRSWTIDGSVGARAAGGELRFAGTYFYQNPGTEYQTDWSQVSGEQLPNDVMPTPPNPFGSEAESEVMTAVVSYEHPAVLGHALNASVYAHDEWHVRRAAELYEGVTYYTDTDQENQRQGLRSALSRGFALGGSRIEATYGLDLQRQRFYRPWVDPAADGAIIDWVSPEVMLESFAFFAQPQLRVGRVLLNGGVRYERFYGEIGRKGADVGAPSTATPGKIPTFGLTLFNLGVVYDLNSSLQLYGGFSQGAEIAQFGRAARGATDPNLIELDGAPSSQYEAGLRGRAGAVDVSGALFYSRSDESAQMDENPTCAGEPFCPLIPVRMGMRVKGVEATAEWVVNSTLTVGGLGTFQDGEIAFPGDDPIPLSSAEVSPLRGIAYAEFEPLGGWMNRFQASYTAASDVYTAAHEAEGYRDSKSVFLTDFTTSLPLGPGRVGLGIQNLLNERYVNVANSVSGDYFYYLSEGRRTTLSYSVRW